MAAFRRFTGPILTLAAFDIMGLETEGLETEGTENDEGSVVM